MQEFVQQMINGLSAGAIYALIAVGYTMVYGVLRLINFAHGDIYMIGAMTGLLVFTRSFTTHAAGELPILVALGLALVLLVILVVARARDWAIDWAATIFSLL